MPSTPEPLPPEKLCTCCDSENLDFETTQEIRENNSQIVGQERVLEAIEFGIGIQKEGYNFFALGPSGTGKYSTITHFLKQKAGRLPSPSDWCYVNNFSDSRKPVSLQFPSGKGGEFQKHIASLLDDLKVTVPSIFESEEYGTRKQIIEEEFREKRDNALEDLREKAGKKGLALLRTPEGLAFAPIKDGDVIGPEEYGNLSDRERKHFEAAISDLQEALRPILKKIPVWEKQGRERIKQLNRELTRQAVEHLLQELREKYSDLEDVVAFLNNLQEDVVENSDVFLKSQEDPLAQLMGAQQQKPLEASSLFRRYHVNVLVTNDPGKGAPIVYEDNPTYQNLVGQLEHIASMGALITDFTLIKAGALHRANGGYLILDAERVLIHAYAWEGLKRALRSREIRIESLGEALSLVTTVSLEPQPIPLKVKIVLLGERMLYYTLSEHDPEFDELFKVAVDFDDRMPRSPENDRLFGRFIATLIEQENLRPFDRSAVARVIDQSARLVEDSERLTLHRRSVTDLLRESDFWASSAGHETVSSADVNRAIEAQIRRSDRLRERMEEEVLRGNVLIETEGSRVGQINGLSVISLGQLMFGKPNRISARVRMGRGEVIDIEREVELGGPIHSKGVLILAGYLGARYSRDHPLSLAATLVFEQSYSGVEGDSASSAELYALLSAISEVPVKQSLAVTGSVNQYGQIQAIGGVNQKIEGFFDVCRKRGLTGEHGVLIPASNVKHLMLRRDVVETCEKGLFHIYAVATIDQGIEILTGIPAGERGDDGSFPEGSINCRIEERLLELAEKQVAFSRTEGAGGDEDADCE